MLKYTNFNESISLWKDKSKLEELIDKGYSIEMIAAELGCSKTNVIIYLAFI
jgi:biotin operon repressor